MSLPSQHLIRLAALLILPAVAACTDARTPVESDAGLQEPAIRASLSPEIQGAVGAAGLFTESVRNPAPGAPGEISSARAREIAMAWATHYGPLLAKFYEDSRGAPIAWEALSACGRSFYAAAPFEATPGNVPLAVQRTAGPWWLVTVCGPGGDPQLSVAVSAWATDLEIVHRDNGDRPPSRMRPEVLLSGPEHSGNHLFPTAIPAGDRATEGFLMSPEEAVERVAALTGATVTGVPELIKIPDLAPQLSPWRIPVDTQVPVRDLGTGRTHSSSEFFVGFHVGPDGKGGVAVMIEDPSAHPGLRELRYRTLESVREGRVADAPVVSAQARRRTGYPLRLMPVELVPDATGARP